ncbi:MFS transporter [Streptomyces sp. NPDC091272]|uniref:MFS transporter n=1 Tax=Streptomyces sp. NPDC091272 TaxID=3365981 RepID=UPI00380B935F
MSTPRPPRVADAGHASRWKALFFIALAQLMVVLDATIVNIALPSAQQDLGLSDSNRQWVITAYALAFGGLLLLGGRISSIWGLRKTFSVGLTGFALASALGGVATNEAMLLSARALQGAFGALLAPAAMGLLSVTFSDARERAKAFGIFGAIAGGGGAVGLILGGLLTQYLDWRWTFFVNIPFAVIAVAGAVTVIRDNTDRSEHTALDVPGALLSTLGIGFLVYGFTAAETDGWLSVVTLGSFAAAVVLLIAFVVRQRTTHSPLLPLRVVLDRNRGGAYLSLGMSLAGVFAVFLFLTYYLQVVRGYTPVTTGLAFIPLIAGMIVGNTQIGGRLMTRVRPRLLMSGGFLAAALGLFLLSTIVLDTSYAAVILPGQLIMGLGLGAAFSPAMNLATQGLRPEDAGAASAMVNTSQQIGGAVGTALLNTIAASATVAYLDQHTSGAARQNQALTEGYSQALLVGAGILLLSTLAAALFINADVVRQQPQEDQEAVPALAH